MNTKKRLKDLPLEILDSILCFLSYENLFELLTLNKFYYKLFIGKIYFKLNLNYIKGYPETFEKYSKYIHHIKVYTAIGLDLNILDSNTIFLTGFVDTLFDTDGIKKYKNIHLKHLLFNYQSGKEPFLKTKLVSQLKQTGGLDKVNEFSIMKLGPGDINALDILKDNELQLHLLDPTTQLNAKVIHGITAINKLTLLDIQSPISLYHLELLLGFPFNHLKYLNLQNELVNTSVKFNEIIINGELYPKLRSMKIVMNGVIIEFKNLFTSLIKLELHVNTSSELFGKGDEDKQFVTGINNISFSQLCSLIYIDPKIDTIQIETLLSLTNLFDLELDGFNKLVIRNDYDIFNNNNNFNKIAHLKLDSNIIFPIFFKYLNDYCTSLKTLKLHGCQFINHVKYNYNYIKLSIFYLEVLYCQNVELINPWIVVNSANLFRLESDNYELKSFFHLYNNLKLTIKK